MSEQAVKLSVETYFLFITKKAFPFCKQCIYVLFMELLQNHLFIVLTQTNHCLEI